MDVRALMAPVAERLAAVPAIEAAVVVAAYATGTAREDSDVDLFIYVADVDGELAGERAATAADLASPPEPPLVGAPGTQTPMRGFSAADVNELIHSTAVPLLTIGSHADVMVERLDAAITDSA